LFSELIDGAMQQAPQLGRQAIGNGTAGQGFSDMPDCRRFGFSVRRR
jgi:hypothetical protein